MSLFAQKPRVLSLTSSTTLLFFIFWAQKCTRVFEVVGARTNVRHMEPMSFCVKNLRCLVFVPLQLQFFEWFRVIWTRRVCLLRWAGEPPTRLQGSSSPYPFVAGSWRCQVCLLCSFLLPFWFPDSCPLSLEDAP